MASPCSLLSLVHVRLVLHPVNAHLFVSIEDACFLPGDDLVLNRARIVPAIGPENDDLAFVNQETGELNEVERVDA